MKFANIAISQTRRLIARENRERDFLIFVNRLSEDSPKQPAFVYFQTHKQAPIKIQDFK
jgi:hypothetical protein